MAKKRLLAIERKLRMNPELREQYQTFMDEYEKLNHMTKLQQQTIDEDESSYYLPHHAVFKEQSTTTKLRVVFDGSAKTTSGLSLNEVQHAGYEVQDELFCILLRFRKHKYVIAADVAKMYRQILVKEEDRPYQRILWRSEPSQAIQIYQLNTVTYGTRAGAFLAKRCLRQLGEEFTTIYPEASKIIINDFYVDDLLTGADTIHEAKKIKRQLEEILATGCLELRKWASNNDDILSINRASNVSIQADKDPKTLGLKWITETDQLHITVNPSKAVKISKRTILSEIAQIFDPLGLVAPVTVRAKIILQQVWQLQLGWDESLPQDLHTTWKEYHRQLTQLNQVQISRRVIANFRVNLELHGFSDALEAAYGACLYLRTTDKDNNHTVQLLCAKSRVAPLKKVSLPRLELCAALLLAQLAYKVINTLDIAINDHYYWSDSMITLAWIKRPSHRWKTFVANRTSEIQQLTSSNWAHVSSEDNPADLVSRGTNPIQLNNSKLWWHGPSWLSRDKSEWPTNEIISDDLELPEKRSQQATTLLSSTQEYDILKKSSSWSRLTRIIAYCLRFIAKIQKKFIEQSINGLTTREITEAQHYILRQVQQQSFQQELKDLKKTGLVARCSKLLSLNPFLDEQGLIRVGGRLQHANITFNQKHPIILPSNHRISWLIIEYEHKRLLHAGCQAVMSSIRTRYWVLSAKIMVKKIVKKCITCTRMQGVTTKYIMGNLPAARVTPTRPFYVCGVDYAGPLYLKERGRGRATYKAYICIFVCFSTKAVHIELAHDLSTEAFLNCLRRFISRRGRCQKIYSDNGLNFIGAKRELHELGILLIDKKFQSKVAAYAMREQMSWYMSPPYAPHFGGLWESAVKSAKFHLKRVIGETKLTFEEMYTILTQIEACLNSRPLSPLSDDPNDFTPLTPAHFLIGESLMSLPEANVMEIPINRLGRYQHLQFMVQHFWQRWQHEYLHGLQQRTKWSKDEPTCIEPGVMVIIREDNTPPTRWRLGRIVDTKPGLDGVVRVASVKTANGIVLRPVTKLIKLPIEETNSIDEEHAQPSISSQPVKANKIAPK